MPPPRALLAALSVLALALAACTGSSEDRATPTEAPPTTATATPTAPPEVTPTPTPSPTPTPEPTPIPAVQPDATAGGASVVWSGSVANPGIPWTSMRVTVGADPLIDPWRFDLGVIPRTQFQCQPSETESGVTLGGCTQTFSATVDFEAQEMVIAFSEPTSFGARWAETVLRPLWQRDEPQASENVELLWEHRAADTSGSYTDIWAADGVVFAPHFGGSIELLDAASGERIGLIRASSSVLDVKVRDGVLYAATTASGLLIYDVHDPSAPFLLGQYAVGIGASVNLFLNVHNVFLSPPSGPAASDEIAGGPAAGGGVTGSPAAGGGVTGSPAAGGGVTGSPAASDEIARDLVFAINDSHAQTDLRIIDVTNPAAPFEAGRFVITEARSTLEGAHDVHVVNQGDRQIAFLNSLANGFFVLDVTDPADIQVLSQTIAEDNAFSHSGWIGQSDGRLLYLHGDEGADTVLRIYDATNLEAPALLAELQTRPGTSVHNIEIDGRYAYVSYYVDGLRVFDLGNPESPREVAHFDTVAPEDERDILQGNWGVHVEDGVVYLSDRESGIYALQVELP